MPPGAIGASCAGWIAPRTLPGTCTVSFHGRAGLDAGPRRKRTAGARIDRDRVGCPGPGTGGRGESDPRNARLSPANPGESGAVVSMSSVSRPCQPKLSGTAPLRVAHLDARGLRPGEHEREAPRGPAHLELRAQASRPPRAPGRRAPVRVPAPPERRPSCPPGARAAKAAVSPEAAGALAASGGRGRP